MAGLAEQVTQRSVMEDALLADAVLGGGLPPEAELRLHQAGLSYHATDVALEHLRQAEALAPEHPAVLIGFYRFYFYKGRLADALTVAERCLTLSARDIGLPADWRQTTAAQAAFGRYDSVAARFFLFTLKGYAYLQMRVGNLQEGQAAAAKLMELDPSDKIGARVLLDVAARAERDDDE